MEPSVGVRYLVVGGTVVVDEGKIVPDVFPGRAILGPGKMGSGKGHPCRCPGGFRANALARKPSVFGGGLKFIGSGSAELCNKSQKGVRSLRLELRSVCVEGVVPELQV